MYTDPLLDDHLQEYDIRRTRQIVVATDPDRCYADLVEEPDFRRPLPGVPGQFDEPWPSRRLRGAVGDVPTTELQREEGECLVIGAVGRRSGTAICWLAATPEAVHGMEEPGHCRLVSAYVVRDHSEGALVANQVRLGWTDEGPPAVAGDLMKLALANGMQQRLMRFAELEER